MIEIKHQVITQSRNLNYENWWFLEVCTRLYRASHIKYKYVSMETICKCHDWATALR